jgi:O-antigen ligase
MKFPPGLGGRIRNTIWEAGLLLVLPLFFYRGFAEQFTTPKLFLAKCLVIIGLAVWALERIWSGWRLGRMRFSLALPLAAFSAAVLLSCLQSPVPRFSLMEAEFALCGPAWALLLISWERGESGVRRIAAFIAIAGAAVAGVTLLQGWGFDPVLLGGYQVDWGSMVDRMRLYSTFGNPNFVGGYLIGTVFAALALAAISKARWGKFLWLGFALVILAAILATGSRGAWLGLTLGSIAAAACVIPRNGAFSGTLCGAKSGSANACVTSRSGSSSGTIGAGSGSAKMSLAPVAIWPAAIGPVAMLTLSLAERVAAQFYGRLYLWIFSWPMFWRHPLAGSGWGTYQLLYLDLQGQYLAAHPEYVGYWTNNRLVHNDPLQVLLETGVIGLMGFIWVLWRYAREALAVRRQATGAWSRYAVAASVGGVAAILADSVFNYQFAVPPTYILLFTLLAIPCLLSDKMYENESAPRAALELPARQIWCKVARKSAGIVGISIMAFALLWHQTRILESEWLYQKASDREDHNNMAGAEVTFRSSVNLNDLNGRAHFGLSRVLSSRGHAAEALEEIVRAERTYTDSHQEVLRARILEQLGRYDEALAANRHALWMDPTLTSVQDDINRLSTER